MHPVLPGQKEESMADQVKIIGRSQDSFGQDEHFLSIGQDATVLQRPEEHPMGLWALRGVDLDSGREIIQNVRVEDVEPQQQEA